MLIFYSDPEIDAGLWLGTIDDLWSFGKPTGSGGPWLNSAVKAGEISDPFLMLGFDEKELILSHNSQDTVSFELFADFNGEGDYKLFEVIQVVSRQEKLINSPMVFLQIG